MRIVSNEKLIRRNARLGQIASLGGLGILAAGMYVSFRYPEQFALAWLALMAGFILSQIGLYYGNRWGRRPRPDEHLNQALKSLDDRYTLYHYHSPTYHLLVGPAGIWILMPRYQTGRIVYEKGRIRQKGGGLLQGYLRLFAQEGLGRPELEIPVEIENTQRYLRKRLPETKLPQPQAALVFTSEKAQLDLPDDLPFVLVPLKKLKEVIRKAVKTQNLSAEQIKTIQEAIEGIPRN